MTSYWFFASAANMVLPSTVATTWFVITTATPQASAKFIKARKNYARLIYLAASSALPEKSVLYRWVQESTTNRANLFSIIKAFAYISNLDYMSVLCARAYAILSKTIAGSSLNHLAIGTMFSGLKVPSVSMNIAIPSPPSNCTDS